MEEKTSHFIGVGREEPITKGKGLCFFKIFKNIFLNRLRNGSMDFNDTFREHNEYLFLESPFCLHLIFFLLLTFYTHLKGFQITVSTGKVGAES